MAFNPIQECEKCEVTRIDVVSPKILAIKITTELDKGSPEIDKTGNIASTKQGMIYGKTYSLEVDGYQANIEPDDKNDIHWTCTYTSEDGSFVILGIKEKGEKIKFKVDELDMLGKDVVFHAIIGDDSDSQASTECIWIHYRFRWLPRKEILNQMQNRLTAPWKIDQGTTPLCGIACLFYILIQKRTRVYEQIVSTLHRTGVATYNNYTIKPHKESEEIMYELDPKSSKFPKMPIVDWLTLATIRSGESSWNGLLLYSGLAEEKDIQQIFGVNWPNLMTKLCKEFLAYQHVNPIGLNWGLIQQKKRPLGGRLYDKFSNSYLEHLQNMEIAYKKRHKVIMLIDSQMFENKTSYSYGDLFNNLHWIVYEGGLMLLDKEGNITNNINNTEQVNFNFFTWGYNPIMMLDERGNKPDSRYNFLVPNNSIEVSCFKSTFLGYIECWDDIDKYIDSPIPYIENNKNKAMLA